MYKNVVRNVLCPAGDTGAHKAKRNNTGREQEGDTLVLQ